MFLSQDNEMLDKYMDDILGDLKLTSKQTFGLLGLCKIYYSMGMVEMQETLKSDLIARLKENISYSTSPSCTKGMELFIKSIER